MTLVSKSRRVHNQRTIEGVRAYWGMRLVDSGRKAEEWHQRALENFAQLLDARVKTRHLAALLCQAIDDGLTQHAAGCSSEFDWPCKCGYNEWRAEADRLLEAGDAPAS